MRIAVWTLLALAAAIGLFLLVDPGRVGAWAIEAQRSFQNQMAGAVRGLKTGDAGAYLALLSAAAAYGFVHAVGPGHGKYLVGGVGLGTAISTVRLLGLAIASSLAQALWAILLVYGGFYVLEASAHRLTALAEDILAPASYIAIAGIGLVIIWRGIQTLRAAAASSDHRHPASHRHSSDHHHPEGTCGCGHAHGPTPDQAAQVTSVRDALGLVLSIAIRPCTGAIFLLVIAWQMDIKVAGALAVAVMGLGTAALTSLVAISSVAARGLVAASSSSVVNWHVALPALQISAGALIALISLSLLGFVT